MTKTITIARDALAVGALAAALLVVTWFAAAAVKTTVFQIVETAI